MSFPDIRTEFKDEEDLAMVALVKNWPCLPGRGAEKTAGFDCAVILLRTISAMFRPQDRPKKDQDDDAIDQYIWATFERMEDGYEEKLETMRSAAFAEIVKQTGETSVTFSQLCRGPMMVAMIWNHPSNSFLLTHPVVQEGLDAPDGRIIKDRLAVATEGVVSWDGVTPSTVAEAVNGVTSQKVDGSNTVYVNLDRPWVLQVDLTKGDSNTSLMEMWCFEAEVSVAEPVPASADLWQYRKEKQCYGIMAIVRCRDPPHRMEDHIRVFDRAGREVMPDLEPQLAPIWAWSIDEPIPAGERMHVFYRKVSSLQHPRPVERLEIVTIPRLWRAMMENTMMAPSARESDEEGEASKARDMKRDIHTDTRQGGGKTLGDLGQASSTVKTVDDRVIPTGPKADARRGDAGQPQSSAQARGDRPIPTGPRAESQSFGRGDMQGRGRHSTGGRNRGAGRGRGVARDANSEPLGERGRGAVGQRHKGGRG